MTIDTDIGPFSIVPEWVLLSASARALRVWCALARFSTRSGAAWPSLAAIAKKLGMSADTVRRGIRELEAIGALEVVERRRENGSQTSNVYLLRLCKIAGGSEVTPRKSAGGGWQICQGGVKGLQICHPQNEKELESPREEMGNRKISGSDMQRVVDAYAKMRGWTKEARDAAYRSGREPKRAKELIRVAGGVDEAISIMKKIRDWAVRNSLSWTLETCIKSAADAVSGVIDDPVEKIQRLQEKIRERQATPIRIGDILKSVPREEKSTWDEE